MNNSGLSSPRLRRRDCSFDKSVALHATPICRKDWKPFAVLAHSFANISCGATLAPTCRAAGERRTSHAKPPAADASDRGSARLRLRAGRTTRSLLSCLVPPSKRPSDRRGQGEAAPNRCKPQTKGQTMSTTNNQSIRQINTAALRGTREAHQPDALKPTASEAHQRAGGGNLFTVEDGMSDRFSVGATPRSPAYRRGFEAKLRRLLEGTFLPGDVYQPGTPEADAYWAGCDHAAEYVECRTSRMAGAKIYD